MRHTPRPFPVTIRAESIETGDDVIYKGLVGAITYMTREDLRKLGDAYMQEHSKVVGEQSKQAEQIILGKLSSVISTLSGVNRGIGIPITLDMKEKMHDELPAIQYLFSNRYGELAGFDLNTLLNSNNDEPFDLIFIIGRRSNGEYFIEKILLKEGKNTGQK